MTNEPSKCDTDPFFENNLPNYVLKQAKQTHCGKNKILLALLYSSTYYIGSFQATRNNATNRLILSPKHSLFSLFSFLFSFYTKSSMSSSGASSVNLCAGGHGALATSGRSTNFGAFCLDNVDSEGDDNIDSFLAEGDTVNLIVLTGGGALSCRGTDDLLLNGASLTSISVLVLLLLLLLLLILFLLLLLLLLLPLLLLSVSVH